MLIDRTYFIGDLNLPNIDSNTEGNGNLLDWFIQKYEPDYLKMVLGLDLFNQFTLGITNLPIAAKWQAILTGGAYTHRGIAKAWEGLITLPPEQLNVYEVLRPVVLEVDRGLPGDPESTVGGLPNRTLTVPATIAGKPFTLEQRLYGTIADDEYTLAGNELTFLYLDLNPGDRFFFKAASLNATTTEATYKWSPIAGYVYYWYMRNELTHTSGVGEVKPRSENAGQADASAKMARAYNESIRAAGRLREYLQANASTYNWKYYNTARLGRVNIFNV